MPKYEVVLNIESEMGDPNKWDWETLLITDPDVERIIDVTVTSVSALNAGMIHDKGADVPIPKRKS